MKIIDRSFLKVKSRIYLNEFLILFTINIFFQTLIMESYEVIEESKDSRIAKMKKKSRKLENHENISNFCDKFKMNILIKFSTSVYKRLKRPPMNSSPINPDDYFDQIYSIELIAFLSTVFNLIKVIILVVK